ncbi:helix-turn-helix domain-containing protein [Streptomyces sp. NPDC059740]|uniref:helix-turn-helix domain-containing protein n=1 Tax=Streptomyces sp. NPDC059740 TaxID=3346926 RepID=UPI0036615803
MPVSAWIRHQRLERARLDLSRPGLEAAPVYNIASRWGFKDHATLSRAFRSVYGVPPTAHRCPPLASEATPKLRPQALPGSSRALGVHRR